MPDPPLIFHVSGVAYQVSDERVSRFLDREGMQVIRDFLDDVEMVHDAPGLIDIECRALGYRVLKEFQISRRGRGGAKQNEANDDAQFSGAERERGTV